MAYIYRLILLFIASISIAQAATYTPPMTYRLLTSLGGFNNQDKGAAINVCESAMAPVNTRDFSAATQKAISVKTCTQQTNINNGGNQEQYFDIYALYNLSNGNTYSVLVGAAAQICTAPDIRGGNIPAMYCTVAACTLPKSYFDVTTNTCILPPTCVAGEGPTGYLSTSSCLSGCTHTWSGQSATIGTIKYGMYLAKTGGTCTVSVAGLMNKGDVDAAMAKADSDAADAAAAAKAAADAKAVAAKADADAKAKLAKAAADAAAKAEADAKTAADKAAADAADASKTQAQKDASAAAAAAAKTAADTAKADAATKAGAAAGAALPSPDATPEFCALHPTSIICKNSSIVAGTCAGGHSSGFSCSGDAIQCQIAQEQAERECQLYAPSNEAELGKRLLAGTDSTDSLNPSLTANREVIDLPTSLQEGSNIGGGEFADYHVSLPGGGVTLPFSRINFVMHILGAFILAGAYLNAARIVGVRG